MYVMGTKNLWKNLKFKKYGKYGLKLEIIIDFKIVKSF